MPFSKDLAPSMLYAHHAHQQAVARICWCVAERQIGVISGECGSGKTVAAMAAAATLDASRHTILYLGTPGVGLRRVTVEMWRGEEDVRISSEERLVRAEVLYSRSEDRPGGRVVAKGSIVRGAKRFPRESLVPHRPRGKIAGQPFAGLW